ncbi:unnamed protein product [Gadus morhua 'NCC']
MSAIFPVEYDRFSRGVSPLGQSLAQPGNPTLRSEETEHVHTINRHQPREVSFSVIRCRRLTEVVVIFEGAAETRSPSSSPRPVKDVEVGLLRVAGDPPGINPAHQTTQALLGYHI